FGEADRHQPQVAVTRGEKVRMCSQEFLAPFGQRGEQTNVDLALDRRDNSGGVEQGMITKRKVETAQPTGPVTGNAERINVEHRPRVGRDHQVAVKPVALWLFGPEKIKLARPPSYFFFGKLRGEKEIIELVRSHHQLDGVVRRFFNGDAI